MDLPSSIPWREAQRLPTRPLRVQKTSVALIIIWTNTLVTQSMAAFIPPPSLRSVSSDLPPPKSSQGKRCIPGLGYIGRGAVVRGS